MTNPVPPPDRATLARELNELLVELSIALHRYAMYPDGHPSLQTVSESVTGRLGVVLERRSTLSIGVARNQLVVDGVASDPKNSMLRELASRLHRHHLGAITFSRGVEAGEVTANLKRLAVEAERSGQPLGLGPREELRLGPHIELHPVTFGQLELLHGSDDAGESTGAPLWIGLARAALAGDVSSDAVEPAAIAAAIDQHARSEAYDQAIVGYLLQISESLRASGGRETTALRGRVSRLVAAMRPETLRRLIEMGGDAEQRRRFVLDATHGMSVDAVLEIVKAAAVASGETISHGLLRMLGKMAIHAGAEQGPVSARADAELREQVRSLIADWTLADPNPDAYRSALERMARARPEQAPTDTGVELPEPERLVRLALELDHRSLALWRAVSAIVDRSNVTSLVGWLDDLPEQNETAREVWLRLTSPGTVRRIAAEPVDFASLDRLLPRLDLPAIEPLLDALVESPNRTTRRGLLDRLAAPPVDVGKALVARLADPRWYVQRNMLVLLETQPRVPAGFSAAGFLRHEDARVRREAIKLCLKIPAERSAALIAGFRDPDPQVYQLALVAAQMGCPAEAVAALARRLANETAESDQHPLALKLLGSTRSAEAVKVLLRAVDGGRSWYGRRRLAPKSRELLSALEALATGWGGHPGARRVLARARQSADADIREAAKEVAG